MENPIKLIPAKNQHASSIKKLVISAHLNPTGLVWSRFTIAIDSNNRVVGCVQIKPHRDGSQELASLVIDSDYQGQGIARALMENQIRHHDGNLYLMCRASLGNFYRKFEFDRVSESKMTPYFRKISKLASLVKLMQKDGETLLIMMREA